jgi:hypothetical protein
MEAAHRIPKRLTATKAAYNRRSHAIIVQLRCGLELRFRPGVFEGLAGAKARDLRAVTVTPTGRRLFWPRLNVHVGIRSLLLGTFGSRKPLAKGRIDRFGKEFLKHKGSVASDIDLEF